MTTSILFMTTASFGNDCSNAISLVSIGAASKAKKADQTLALKEEARSVGLARFAGKLQSYEAAVEAGNPLATTMLSEAIAESISPMGEGVSFTNDSLEQTLSKIGENGKAAQSIASSLVALSEKMRNLSSDHSDEEKDAPPKGWLAKAAQSFSKNSGLSKIMHKRQVNNQTGVETIESLETSVMGLIEAAKDDRETLMSTSASLSEIAKKARFDAERLLALAQITESQANELEPGSVLHMGATVGAEAFYEAAEQRLRQEEVAHRGIKANQTNVGLINQAIQITNNESLLHLSRLTTSIAAIQGVQIATDLAGTVQAFEKAANEAELKLATILHDGQKVISKASTGKATEQTRKKVDSILANTEKMNAKTADDISSGRKERIAKLLAANESAEKNEAMIQTRISLGGPSAKAIEHKPTDSVQTQSTVIRDLVPAHRAGN